MYFGAAKKLFEMPIKPVIVKIINLNMEVNQSQCTTCMSTIPSCESPSIYFKNLRFKLINADWSETPVWKIIL